MTAPAKKFAGKTQGPVKQAQQECSFYHSEEISAMDTPCSATSVSASAKEHISYSTHWPPSSYNLEQTQPGQ